MSFKVITFSAVAMAILLSGCATPLSSSQKQEYSAYQARGLSVEEKSPGTGAAFGLLPGGGSFYARETGLGVFNLLLWPLSIFWDPISGYEGALTINYYATKAEVNKKMRKEIGDLDDQLVLGTVAKEVYIVRKRAIETKYEAVN